MNENITYFNGNYILKSELKFQDFHRLRFADSLFESIIAIKGKIPLLQYHLERLTHSCNYLQLDFPSIDFEKIIKELLSKNQLHNNARIRLTVFRSKGELYSPMGTSSSCLIELENYSKKFFVPIQNLGVYSENKKPLTIYSLLKSGNSIHYVIAKQYALNNNFDEVLLMNPNTEIIEGASNNVFFIHEDKIYTPSTSTGCVNGVFKKFLTTEIIENITYAACLEADLESFDEIFLCNAVGMIQPVLNFKNKKFKTTITNKIIDKVSKKLKLYV